MKASNAQYSPVQPIPPSPCQPCHPVTPVTPVNIVILVNVFTPNFLFRNCIVYLVLYLLIIITTNLVYPILACSI